MIILGIDPGLGTTGWGLIQAEGNRLSHIANGQISTNSKDSLPDRLVQIDRELTDLILKHQPDGAAVEEVFVNSNPQSTLKLGQARGAILLSLARTGLQPGEYAARLIKKAVVGIGNALVDVLSYCQDEFLTDNGVEKGIMQLVDRDRAELLYAAMRDRTETPGGSVGNTIAGIGALGLSTAFIGKVRDDALGRFFADALAASNPRSARQATCKASARSIVARAVCVLACSAAMR